MPHILLLGAGFSRNWDGWLAAEIGSDLALRLADDPYLSDLLTRTGGFEDALSLVQAEFKRAPTDEARARLRKFQDALKQTFGAMNDAFAARPDYEFTNDASFQITPFLTKFDAIFTLNQDLLLELHYQQRMEIPAFPRWSGCQFPGMVPRIPQVAGLHDARSVIWTPGKFERAANLQPIYKLHGSTNWRDSDGGELLVMGGDKTTTIQEKAILRWYREEFRRYLSMPSARLMVIGYGFLDSYINDMIVDGAQAGGLRMFIVHPAGRGILRRINPTNTRPVYLSSPIEAVGNLGDSVRGLPQTFGSDSAENGKFWRFLNS